MNHKIIVYQYLHILDMNICLQYLNMLPNNGHKKNNMYIYTLTCSCKQVILTANHVNTSHINMFIE